MTGHGWEGRIGAVQPRILLNRSFDQRWDEYLGYVLILDEDPDDLTRFGITEAQQQALRLRAGDVVRGHAVWLSDSDRDPAEYAASRIEVIERAADPSAPPPWLDVPPELSVYQQRGYRRLATRTYSSKCAGCIWACRMAVEMTIDHWKPRKKKHRAETFCFGPLSCRLYKAGPTRKVPGRRGMTWVEEDWIDEDATGHRDLDDDPSVE